jgi:hypothetical protein
MMGSKFGVRMDSVVAEEMTMGGLDIAMITREVDIYLRAGQIPQVVVRPILERLEAVLEGASIVVSPEVAGMLEDMGWIPPEEAGPMKDALEASRVHHVQCDKRISNMEEDLAQAHGKLADLTLANQGLHDELEEAQRGEPSRAMPYT